MQPKPLSERIKTNRANKACRKDMAIKVLSFNIQQNKLSLTKQNYLQLLKFESKAYYNYLIHNSPLITNDYGNQVSPIDIFTFNTKSNFILIPCNGDHY